MIITLPLLLLLLQQLLLLLLLLLHTQIKYSHSTNNENVHIYLPFHPHTTLFYLPSLIHSPSTRPSPHPLPSHSLPLHSYKHPPGTDTRTGKHHTTSSSYVNKGSECTVKKTGVGCKLLWKSGIVIIIIITFGKKKFTLYFLLLFIVFFGGMRTIY